MRNRALMFVGFLLLVIAVFSGLGCEPPKPIQPIQSEQISVLVIRKEIFSYEYYEEGYMLVCIWKNEKLSESYQEELRVYDYHSVNNVVVGSRIFVLRETWQSGSVTYRLP